MTSLEATVNGQPRQAAVEPATLLVDWLRESLGLTGTHVGCDTAQCGACTVLVDGQAVKSCNLLALQVQGARVTTVEGLGGPDHPEGWHPLQRAFSRCHALQCGYCTPGLLMRAAALVHEDVPAEPAAVAEALDGNLCRCTGYHGIVQAICEGLRELRAQA
ncbi:MAG: (2Fe-2S)-binding protein [Rubrivivax sp.]|nr:(2Fe-2S)-binding protein [Rubrivivax sp.]